MTDLLDTLLIQPLVTIYAGLFHVLKKNTPNTGVALVSFSLLINVLLLPLYAQIERAAQANRWHHAAMNDEIARISRQYAGRERYFYVRAIHRQFGWRPIYVLFQKLDLWLQVVVFVSVYAFLSHLKALKGASFMGIADLSQPDALLFGFNVLPLVMTAFNVLSALVFTSDPAKRRMLLGMAALFLLLLYPSPAGLVIYWTMNNIFSLVKNLGAGAIDELPPLPQRFSQVLHRD